jgi:tRNA1(Val) A37 N6-methylase TrmN6
MNDLAQFNTNGIFSQLLVRQITQTNPVTIIDLGVGDGSLTRAAVERWRNANFYAVDIDRKCTAKIERDFPFVKVNNLNSLIISLDKKLVLNRGTIDVALCNPPYLQLQHQLKYSKMLIHADLDRCIELKKITSDILFLAQNLQFLRNGGELGIILPDSLVTGHEFRIFRENLLAKHKVKGIIELPDKVFLKTEARTHILLIEKGGQTAPIIPVYRANNNGECTDVIEIPSPKLVHRMDFGFHLWQIKNSTPTKRTLNDIGAEIKRGTVYNCILKKTRQPFFHTTNFKSGSPSNSSNQIGASYKKQVTAKRGDIIIARVGKRCLNKVMMVKSKEFIISDCIYRIRVDLKFRKLVFQAFNSCSGQEWIKSNAHGVCAQVISKIDLFNFPVE